MKKIKILYTVSELVYGSKVRQLLDIIKKIDRNKFEIEIGTYHVIDEATKEMLALDVPIKQIWLQPPRQFNCNRLYNFITSSITLNTKYDIIHSFHYSSLFSEALVAKIKNIKYVYTKSNLKWQNHPFNWKVKSMLSDNIITISSEVDKLINIEGFSKKSNLIPPGIDIDYFQPFLPEIKNKIRHDNDIPINSFVFGCAAQFVSSKRQDILIKAFNTLSIKYKDIYLVLCGNNYNDDYYTKVTSLVQQSNSTDRIKLLGIVDDMRQFYNMIDCFVLPSTDEAFGLVYTEAMSCCVPAIGCHDTGAMDIIEDNLGKLILKNNLENLIEAMEKYIMDKKHIAEIGNACRNVVKNKFGLDNVVRMHEEVYENLWRYRDAR